MNTQIVMYIHLWIIVLRNGYTWTLVFVIGCSILFDPSPFHMFIDAYCMDS